MSSLKDTVPDFMIFSRRDPTLLIRQGYDIDSKLARLKLFVHRLSMLPWGFINLKPEGPELRSSSRGS